MTIDPDWLGTAVALICGRQINAPMAQAIATTLAVREEVLPWLILRQDALAEPPETRVRLHAVAAGLPAHATPRDGDLDISAPMLAIDRGLADALGKIVRAEAVRADLGETVNTLMMRRHAARPAGLDQAFRFRIGKA